MGRFSRWDDRRDVGSEGLVEPAAGRDSVATGLREEEEEGMLVIVESWGGGDEEEQIKSNRD